MMRYGLASATADNTLAIQASVNQSSHGGNNPYCPIGKYVFKTNIYGYYHLTNNPGFMPYVGGSTDYLQGHISIFGERPLTYGPWDADTTDSRKKGSQLSFDPAGGTGDGWLMGNDTLARHRAFKFKHLTLSGGTSGVIIKFIGSSLKCGLEDCTVFQSSTGGGLYFEDCWGMAIHSTYCRNSGAANVGYGIQYRKLNLGGGIGLIIDSNFKGFKFGGEFGEYGWVSGDALTLQTVAIYHTEFGGSAQRSSQDGILLGQHTAGVTLFDTYVENCTRSILRADGQHISITITGGHFAVDPACTDNAMVFGVSGGTAAQNRQQTVNINGGADFTGLPSNRSYIERNVGNNTGSMNIEGIHAASASVTGTKFLEINGDGAGVKLDGNDLYSTTAFAQEYSISGSGPIDYYRSGNRTDGTLGDTFIKGIRQYGAQTYTYAAAAQDIDNTYQIQKFDSTGGAFTVHAQDGIIAGHRQYHILEVDGGDVTLDYTTDTSRKGTLSATQTFNDVNDILITEWDGSDWTLVHNDGTI